jgi:hypothetical protein
MATFTDDRVRLAAGAPRSAQGMADGLGPVARAVIITLATVFGSLLIPHDAQPADAMRNSAIVLTFALLLIPAVEALSLGIKPALKVRNLLLVGIVYWLMADLVQGLYPIEATTEGIETAFLATGIFAAGLSIGGAIRVGGLPVGIRRIVRVELSDRQVLALATFCFVVGIFYFVFMADFSPSLIMEALLDKGRFAAPWARGSLGDWHSFIEQFTYFGYLLPPFAAVMYMRSRSLLSLKTIYCLLLSTCFLVFPAQSGGRTNIGATLGSALLVAVLLSRRSLRTIHVVMMLAALVAVQVAMNVILQNRGSGYGDLRVNELTFSTIRVDDNFNRLAQTADFVPEYFPYSGLQFVVFSVVRPIPRALWPGKPVYQGFTVQEALGDEETSLTNSVIGEAYSGYGFSLVLVMGMFFGALARWWEQTLEDPLTSGGVMLYALGGMALFGALRGFVNIVLLSYPILSLWAASVYFRYLRGRSVGRRRSA